jgi:hypothetical protein
MTTGIDVSRIAQMFRGKQPNTSSSTQAWIFGTIAVILSLLTLILIYLRFYPRTCVPTSQLPSILSPITQASTSSVTGDPIELQILPKGNADSPDVRGEAREKSQPPTRFIQHGVLPADV